MFSERDRSTYCQLLSERDRNRDEQSTSAAESLRFRAQSTQIDCSDSPDRRSASPFFFVPGSGVALATFFWGASWRHARDSQPAWHQLRASLERACSQPGAGCSQAGAGCSQLGTGCSQPGTSLQPAWNQLQPAWTQLQPAGRDWGQPGASCSQPGTSLQTAWR